MRIVIADCQSKVRNAIRVLLNQQLGLEIVGEAQNTGELLALAEVCCPDLVVLHWRLQGSSAVDLLPALRRSGPGLRILALSARSESHEEALAAGAGAFVSKIDGPQLLAIVVVTLAVIDAVVLPLALLRFRRSRLP